MQIQTIDYRSSEAPQQFTAAFRNRGFAVLTNHPIDLDLIADNFKLWRHFFRSREKFDYPFHPRTHDGFVSLAQSELAKGYNVKDIKEFYHFHPAGRCPSHIKPQAATLYYSLTVMAKKILGWLDEQLPEKAKARLSLPLAHMISENPYSVLRIAHYPPLTGNEELGALRAAPHEDINIVTLTPASDSGGLEVKDEQGRWLPVPCIPGTLVVNAGDMLQECTAGYFPSATHRVVNPSGIQAKQSRLSMPMFLHPHDSVVLSERHTAASYRLERFSEIGLV